MILSVLYCTIVYLPSVQTTLKNLHNHAGNKSFTSLPYVALQLVRSSLQALQYATLQFARTALQAVISISPPYPMIPQVNTLQV
jgi:hypothetical protein